MVDRYKTAQFLSGFIYTDNNQSYPLPDGTRVTGRCQEPEVCKNVSLYGPVGGQGNPVAAGQKIPVEKAKCTGVCLDRTPQQNKLPQDNSGDCGVAGGDWFAWKWHEPKILADVNDEFVCLNKPQETEYISYAGSKYIETDFLPAEEWRRSVGWRWGDVATVTSDGMFIPFSAQFRAVGEAACIKNACEDPQYTKKADCEANNKKWKVTKLTGVCKDANGQTDPSYPKEQAACENAGYTWESASDPDACEAQGGVPLPDPGDKFDDEIPKGFLPSYYSPDTNNFPGSGVTTSVTMNPYASGHNVSVVNRNKALNEHLGDAMIRKADYGDKIGSLSRKPKKNKETYAHRPMALRGPLVVAGWGYDTEDLPVPNEYHDADEYTIDDTGKIKPVYPGHCSKAGSCSDPSKSQDDCDSDDWTTFADKETCTASVNGTCSVEGYCTDSGGNLIGGFNTTSACSAQNGEFHYYTTKEECNSGATVGGSIAGAGEWATNSWIGVPQNKVPESHFYFNHLKRPDKWKVGPVDLKWDRDRKVWTAGGRGGGGLEGISLCKATRCILPQAGTDGKNSFNFGILDNINSPGRIYRNPCSNSDCGFGTYFPVSTMYPDIEIYDPEDYEWCGNCQVKKDSSGNYYVACDDFHSTCVPFYDAIVIRDMKDYVWGNDRSITTTAGHHHALRAGDTNCGDKFNKTHRGDPYNRRMGNPCHEFGNSILGEQIPLSQNPLYPNQAKSVLYKRVLIENPLGQGLMVGDSFLSADTGKRITVEYVRKRPGTGSSNCTGANASPETVKEVLPVHIILQGEFYGQEILTAMGCEQGEASACSKKIMVQGITTMEDCGPNDDYPQSSTSY